MIVETIENLGGSLVGRNVGRLVRFAAKCHFLFDSTASKSFTYIYLVVLGSFFFDFGRMGQFLTLCA